MKKSLLSLGLLVAAVLAFGQSNPLLRKAVPVARTINLNTRANDGIPYKDAPIVTAYPKPKITTRSGGVVETKVSSSYNALTITNWENKFVKRDNSVGIIDFIHRECQTYPGGSGWIQSTFSMDNGLTWDSSMVTVRPPGTSTTAPKARYPAGGIYNPAGNTDPTKAFTVMSGPMVAADWDGYYFGSQRFDTAYNNQQIFLTDSPSWYSQMYFPDQSFIDAGQNQFVEADDKFTSLTATGYQYSWIINRSTFNSENNAMDWDQTKIPIQYYPVRDTSYTPNSAGTFASNDDGSIVYFFVFDVDSLNPVGYYPLIWETTDHGNTWTKLPFYDFRNIPLWQQMNGIGMFPTSSGEVKPFFQDADGTDAVVDANGHLHIITCIFSAASDNPDSLDLAEGPANNNNSSAIPLFFDVYQTETGWNAVFLGFTAARTDFSDIWTEAGAAFPVFARLQAAISPDRQKEFIFWLDTDSNLSLINEYPDIWGEEVDFSSGSPVLSDQVNFTGNTDYAYNNEWLCLSDKAFQVGDSLDIPAVISRSADGSYEMINPMNHYYVGGMSFPNGISAVHNVQKASFNVSQNFPNPFGNSTEIKITMPKAASVIFKVTNMLGSTIQQQTYNWGSGSHFVSLGKQLLTPGVYYYSVTIGNEQVTKKMIVN